MSKKKKGPPLEEGLMRAMSALDRQVAREMQRGPAEREARGVQKWEPHSKRVEQVAALLLEKVGSGELQLDSLLICSQAMLKALMLLSEDLGSSGLGKVRTGYCVDAFERLSEDARRGLERLRDSHDLI